MYFYQITVDRSRRSLDENVADRIGQMEEVRLRRFAARIVAVAGWIIALALGVTYLTTGVMTPMPLAISLAAALTATWASRRCSQRLDGIRTQMVDLLSLNRKDPHVER